MFGQGSSRAAVQAPIMRSGNPLQDVLRQQVGLDAFAIDGDDTLVLEPWTDRPGRARTPVFVQR